MQRIDGEFNIWNLAEAAAGDRNRCIPDINANCISPKLTGNGYRRPRAVKGIQNGIARERRPADNALKQAFGLLGIVTHVLRLWPMTKRSHRRVIPKRVHPLPLDPAAIRSLLQKVLDINRATRRAVYTSIRLETRNAVIRVVAPGRGCVPASTQLIEETPLWMPSPG